MLKKMLVVALVLTMITLTSTSLAEGTATGGVILDNGCLFVSGEANFILNANARIVGVKAPNESVEHLEYQYSEWKIPSGNVNKTGFIRAKAVSKVMLKDESILLGTTIVNTAITIYPEAVEFFKLIMGEEFTANDVIMKTIYFREQLCELNWYAGHRFFIDGQAAQIGIISFENGTYGYLYAGDWDNDCVVELGFKAGYQETRQCTCTCFWNPAKMCWVSYGYGSYGYYAYELYVKETYIQSFGGYGYQYCGGQLICH